MERLSGRTLRDELADGPMPAERVRDVGSRFSGRSRRRTTSGSSTET
jgi:hypothetical protein